MEYFQIIFVHEGDTDKLYIRKLIEKLYPELNVNKLTFISMNGKTNYSKMEKKIEEKKNKFSGSSKIIFVIDTDNISSNSNDLKLFNEIENYIKQKKYHLIFLNPDIESVFIPEKKIKNKSDKKIYARHFTWNDKINLNKLKSKDYSKNNTSNICIILEKIKNIIILANNF
ncbi:TOPRIM nucleotidyl transferase/hydrolase domain-containing protein [Fusobacterium polymorphum]|uniref:TOPRIM nucleotidyl transferase/hydrolase domain-containing protein n=1 Tax=Fusobacterium nucleatum subsp. polymorphum TaxID=76857 RepID=UPI0030089433